MRDPGWMNGGPSRPLYPETIKPPNVRARAALCLLLLVFSLLVLLDVTRPPSVAPTADIGYSTDAPMIGPRLVGRLPP